MRFVLPDGDGFQEITIKDGRKAGEVQIDLVSKEETKDIIEANKRAQRGAVQKLGKGTQTSMELIGRLGNLQAHKLMQQGIYWDDDALKRWLNDLDNYLWRVKDKKRGTHAI